MDRWIGAGGRDQSLWVDVNGSGYLWISASGGDRCLWVLILVVLVVES